MVDYTGNSKKGKGEVPGPEEKNLEKVVAGPVVERKKSLGTKLKEAFIAADYKSTGNYVFWQVMLPAAKNMLWDMGTKAWSRTLYGQDSVGGVPGAPRPGLHGQQTHIQYNQPVQRLPWQTPQRPSDPRLSPTQPMAVAQPAVDYIVSSQAEAQRILTMLQDTTEVYTVATVADLHTLLGIQVLHTDHTWGWETMAGARAYQVRQGWALELPPPKPV
jgi:hypothetical protein